MTGNVTGRAAALAGILVATLSQFAAPARAEPEATPSTVAPPPNGTWQAHKYEFQYMGFTTSYTCDGLEDKLRLLLRLTGAKPDLKVVGSCARGLDRPDRMAMATLTFSSLQPDAPGPDAPGVWQHVELSPQHPFDLGGGDCELVEEFRDRVLPLFAVKNLVNGVTCVPHQDIGSNFHLSFDVFAPVKPPKAPRQPSKP